MSLDISGWEKIAFKDLIVENKKSSLKVSDASNFGNYNFYTSGESILKHHQPLVDGENMYLATGGVANVKYEDGDAAYSTDTYSLKTKENKDTKYLYYYVLNNIKYINDNFFQGSGLKHLQKKDLKQFLINIPNDINEQKKIAEILTKVDEAIENTEKLIQKYEQVKVGLMQDLLTKGIDENGNIRSEETHQFKDSPLGRIPVEWDCDTLGSIYKMKSGITPSRAEKSYFDDNGTNWVKTLDLNEDRLFSTEEKISKKAINFTAISVLPTDSILIAMYGGWEQIGRTSILGKPSATNQAITALFNPNKQLKSEYTMSFLQTNRWRWKQFAVSTRKDPNITKKDISNFNIAYPINETEQLYIISKIDSVKKYIDNIKSTLYKLKNQKQGLMQDLLSGKVRVNY